MHYDVPVPFNFAREVVRGCAFLMRTKHTTTKVRTIQLVALTLSIVASLLAIIETLCRWLL